MANLSICSSSQIHHNTRNADKVETYYCRTDIFKNSFFPYTIIEWNKLDIDIQKSKSYGTFRNTLLKLGRPIQRAIYSINNPVGLSGAEKASEEGTTQGDPTAMAMYNSLPV